MIIYRDYTRPQDDDFKLNVASKLDKYTEALPISDNDSILIGWKIQSRYE